MRLITSQLRVNTKLLLQLMFYFFIIVFLVVYYFVSDLTDVNEVILADFYIAVFVYVLSFAISKYTKKGYNVFVWFLFLTFFFFFGQHTVFFLSAGEFNLPISDRADFGDIRCADFYTLASIIFMQIGYCIFRIFGVNKNNIVRSINEMKIEKNTMHRLSRVILVTLFIPFLYLYYTRIMYVFTQGYGSNIGTAEYSSGVLVVFMGIVSPAILMYFLSMEKHYKRFVLMFCCYCLLILASGTRIQVVTLSFIILYISALKGLVKIGSLHKTIKIFIYILVFAVLMNLLSYVRGGGNIINIVSYFDYFQKNNLIYSVLKETGYTGFVTTVIVDFCPSTIPFAQGLSYLNGLIYILPNIFVTPILGQYYFNTDMIFSPLVTQYGGIGSSFVAESYFNFGVFGVIVNMIFGYLWGVFATMLDKAIEENKLAEAFLASYAISCAVFFVRSDTGTFLRNYIWFGVTLFLLIKYLSRRRYYSMHKAKERVKVK